MFVDGDVGVGVFPEGEKVFVSGKRSDAVGIGIRALQGSCLQRVCTRHAQTRQGSRPAVPNDAAVVENLLELGGSFFTLPGCGIRLTANVARIEAGNIGDELVSPAISTKGKSRRVLRLVRRPTKSR